MAKFIFISTHYDDNLEKATLPWVMATSAQAIDHEVIVFLQGKAVQMATKTGVDDLPATACLPAVRELREHFLSEGGKIFYRGPCLAGYDIPVTALVEGASAAGTAFLVEQSENAKVFTY